MNGRINKGDVMKNLIFTVFAFKDGFKNSPQLGGKADKKTIDVYMKNICVSLISAKLANPRDDVMLVVNKKIEEKYKKIFDSYDIKIRIADFLHFQFPERFSWALAFFKLNSLKWVVENLNYDNYLLIDADTITINNFNGLWLDAQYSLVLYNIGHSAIHRERKYIIDDYQKLFDTNELVQHYGGEFIAGNKKILKEFIDKCEEVYNTIKASNFNVAKNIGDETIISIAANTYHVSSASPYIVRNWTGNFYLASTNYHYNKVAILHVPNEKNVGFIKIYDYFNKNKKFPSIRKIRFYLGLPIPRRPIVSTVFYIFFRGIRKI